MKPSASIIIPSYNSEKTIEACIDSVLKQKTNLPFEIIVADSSTDNTPRIVGRYGSRVKLIHSDRRMVRGKARNVGIAHARADIIICLDSDCVVQGSDWLALMCESAKKHPVVGARIANGNPWKVFGWGLFLMEFGDFVEYRVGKKSMLLSYCVAYQKSFFQKYGRFPEHDYINEDLLLHVRINKGLFFLGDVSVRHTNRTGFIQTLKHSYALGLGSGMARKQHPDLEGHFLFKMPFTIMMPLLIPYRFLRTAKGTIFTPYVLFFILFSPLILVDLIAYTAGFMSAARNKRLDKVK